MSKFFLLTLFSVSLLMGRFRRKQSKPALLVFSPNSRVLIPLSQREMKQLSFLLDGLNQQVPGISS